MGNFVMVKNCFRKDLFQQRIEGFDENHLLVLMYMQRFTAINRGEINFCMGWLFEDLGINKSSTRKELINSLFDLVDMGLIELVKDIDRDKVNKNTRIRTYAIEYEDNFTKIYDNEIYKIFDSDIDFGMKKTMLFLYVDIASRIDTKGYCYPSFLSFKSDINTTSDSRINDSLQMLKKFELIDYDNVGQIAIGGQVTQGNNVYVLCCQEDYKDILQRGLANRKKQYVEGKATVTKKKQSNLQRSISMKWRHRLNKYYDGTITDTELKELEQLEKQYFELIKDTELKEERIDEFVLFNPIIKKEENKSYFGKPKHSATVDTSSTTEQENDNWNDEEVDINDVIDNLFGVDEEESIKMTTINAPKRDNIELTTSYNNNITDEEMIEQEIDSFRSMYSYIDKRTIEEFLATNDIQKIFNSAEFTKTNIESKRKQIQNILNNSYNELDTMQRDIDIDELFA